MLKKLYQHFCLLSADTSFQMNILKRFFLNNNAHSGDKSVMISSGMLFLVRSPSSPKSENECLYNDAMLSISETTNPFNYQLVVSKSSGDQDGYSNDEAEPDDTDDGDLFEDSNVLKTFLIDQELKFCLFHRHNQEVIAWRDIEGDIGDVYEYRIDRNISQDTIDHFMLSIYKCEYERKYKRSSARVTADHLQEFIATLEEARGDDLYNVTRTPKRRTKKAAETSSDDESDFQDAEEGKSDPKKGTLMGQDPCQLFVYDPEKQSFKSKDKSANVKLLDLGNWDYWLELDGADSEPVVASYVIEQLDAVFRFEQLCFIFNYFSDDEALTYLVKFADRDTYESFQRVFAKAVWEHTNQARWSTAKAAEAKYLEDAYSSNPLPDEDEVMSDIGEDANDEDVEMTERRVSLSNSVDEQAHERFKSGDHNTALKISAKNDRAFVTRGDKLGVFTTGSDDDDLEFYTAIENISNASGKKRVNPGNTMLQKGDSVMVIQDRSDPNTLYKMDLNRGKVVEDWHMEKDSVELPVTNFTGSEKYSGVGTDETFLGVSSQALFKVDPRLKNKIVDSQYKQYKSKAGFTQIATTEDGYIAASTKAGEIKLYDLLGRNAKTALPGLGDDFIGLTTSNDGRFLLATCKTYLLLIDVKIRKGKNRYKLGFERSFAADDKPLPKKLSVRPEHLAYIRQSCGKDVSFTKANFNVSMNSKAKNPTSIITSVGPFAITWNLRKVLGNDPEPYTIRRYNDTVMMGEFTFHNQNRMILTLPDDVTLVSARSFRKPEDAFSVVKEY